MKDKLSLLKFTSISALLALSLACGSVANSSGGGNSADSIYVAKEVNANAAPSSANSNASDSAAMQAANKLIEAEKRIGLPPANPIEKGKPQTFYSNIVSYTVPANWKRTMSTGLEDRFDSPDKKVTLMLSALTWEKTGDMMQEFKKITAAKPEAKVALKPLGGGTLGILNLDETDSVNTKTNRISWESYPPPDFRGAVRVLRISVIFPHGEFEQHKQIISDIYGSVRIKK